MDALSYSSGRKVLTIDRKAFDDMVSRMTGTDQRRAERFALRKGAKILTEATERNFKKLITKNNAGKGQLTGYRYSRGGRQRTDKVVKAFMFDRKTDKDPMVTVTIASRKADFRARFFELGTKERFTKSRRITGSYRIKGRMYYTRRGKPGSRGRIIPGRYFSRAKAATEKQIFSIMRQQMRGWLIRAAKRKGIQ